MSRCPTCGMTGGFHVDDSMVLLRPNEEDVIFPGHRKARMAVDPKLFMSNKKKEEEK